MLPPATAPPHYFRKLAENYATYPNVGHFKNEQSAPVAGQTGKNITRTEISPRVLFSVGGGGFTSHRKNMNPSEANPLFSSSTPPFAQESPLPKLLQHRWEKRFAHSTKPLFAQVNFHFTTFDDGRDNIFFLQAKLTAGNEEYSKDRHLKERDRRNCNQAAASAVCCLPLPVTKAKWWAGEQEQRKNGATGGKIQSFG